MDLVLLALPFAVAATILVVSVVRRRRHERSHGRTEPVHRAQSDTAVVQDAAVYPATSGRHVEGGRERRAGAAREARDG